MLSRHLAKAQTNMQALLHERDGTRQTSSFFDSERRSRGAPPAMRLTVLSRSRSFNSKLDVEIDNRIVGLFSSATDNRRRDFSNTSSP